MQGPLALAFLALSAPPVAQSPIGINPPRLVVLISVDQGRADYVSRFAPYFLPARSGSTLGGFRWLTETGVQFLDAHHDHVPTATGPGHAVLMSGSIPGLDGIIGNDWYDRGQAKSVYCVDDPSVETVGGTSKPMSPRNLRVTTVGDELKMATNGKAKVVGVAFKDRAAILMAGHAADTVIWFDAGTGNWVTSSFYAPTKQLPPWVAKVNAEKGVNLGVGKAWEPLLPDSAYRLTRRAPAEKPSPNERVFSHPLGASADKSYFGNLLVSGQGQDFVFQTVDRAIENEGLGQDEIPDILVVNLATNDYVGHRYGPNSPEVMDITVRTDRLLSGLFNTLNKRVPGGIDNVAIVVSADHGVGAIPEEGRDAYRGPYDRFVSDRAKAIDAELAAQFGPRRYVLGIWEQNLYLDRDAIAKANLKIEDVEKATAEAAMRLPGVYAAFTRQQLLNGAVPSWDWTKLAVNGFSPTMGGDVMVFEAPGVLFDGGTGASHGTAWAYDSHVPILTHWRGQTSAKVARRVYTHDIASTLCTLLGIEYPTGNVGRPLVEALPRG